MFQDLFKLFMTGAVLCLLSLCAMGLFSAYEKRSAKEFASHVFFITFIMCGALLFGVFISMIWSPR